jgi:hypothetical protein
MVEPRPDVLVASPELALGSRDGRLVDLVDTLLEAGVCLRGELWLSVAEVDLVFLGVDVVLCSHDRINAARGIA